MRESQHMPESRSCSPSSQTSRILHARDAAARDLEKARATRPSLTLAGVVERHIQRSCLPPWRARIFSHRRNGMRSAQLTEGFPFGVEVEAEVASFPSDAALLHAPEGRAESTDVLRVNPRHSGVDGFRHPLVPRSIARPRIGGQSIRHRVRVNPVSRVSKPPVLLDAPSTCPRCG